MIPSSSHVMYSLGYNLQFAQIFNNKQNKEYKFVGIMGLMQECFKLVLSLIQKIKNLYNNLILPDQLNFLIISIKTKKSVKFTKMTTLFLSKPFLSHVGYD